MAPLTPDVMVTRGLVFHPLFCIVLISGSYLVCFRVMACSRNMSWQYVNSMSWNVAAGVGVKGVREWFGALIMHRMLGLSLAWHWQGVCGHVHLNSHYGIVWSGGLLLILPTLVSLKNRVFLLA